MTVCLLATLALPVQAGAAVLAPPGNSEADQYFETVPGSSGPRSPNGTKKEEDAEREGDISPATGRALRQRGAVGQTVATAVARTAPAAEAAGAGGPNAKPGGGQSRPAPSPQESGGLGALFPLALVAIALAAVGFAVARRRRPAAP